MMSRATATPLTVMWDSSGSCVVLYAFAAVLESRKHEERWADNWRCSITCRAVSHGSRISQWLGSRVFRNRSGVSASALRPDVISRTSVERFVSFVFHDHVAILALAALVDVIQVCSAICHEVADFRLVGAEV